jgi:nucleoid-associated protein YejK
MASDKVDLKVKASKMTGQTATVMQDVRQTQTLILRKGQEYCRDLLELLFEDKTEAIAMLETEASLGRFLDDNLDRQQDFIEFTRALVENLRKGSKKQHSM